MRKTLTEKKFLLIVTIALLLGTVLGSATYAWLAGSGTIPCTLVEGSILTQYFHCGTGAEDNPFVITRPVHFYNLVYLYQRKPGFADNNYYYQLGYDLNNDGQLEFYNYGDNGVIIDGQYSSELNMNYYRNGEGLGDALLPVGTSDIPFNGTFNGNNLTVKNLHIRSTQTIGEVTYGSSDVGIFGYVNATATISDVYFKDVTISLTGADPAVVCEGNTEVHDVNGDDVQDKVYVGYLAGHIKTSATVDRVYINNCTVTGGTRADSNFGYFGCVEDTGTGHVAVQLGSTISTLRGAGNESGFGGSLNMTGLFSRVYNVLYNSSYGGVSRQTTYPTVESVTAPATPGGMAEVSATSTASLGTITTTENNSVTIYGWFTPAAGRYIGSATSTSSSGTFTYIYGLTQAQTTQVTTYTKTGGMVQAWLISDSETYLSVSGTSPTGTTEEGAAAKFLLDQNNHWYTYINNTVYYLNRSGSFGVTLQNVPAASATIWNRSNGRFFTSSGGTDFYLFYDSTSWSLTPYTESYRISDGNGHYLTANAGGVGNVNQAADSAKWGIAVNGNTYTFSTIIGGVQYYLGYNNGLALTTTTTSWTKDSNGYCLSGSVNRYLQYYSGLWVALPLQYHVIGDGVHYLKVNGPGSFTDTTVANEATRFFFSAVDGAPQGTIQYLWNGALYHLGNNGTSFANTPVTWVNNGNSLQATGTDYYLGYSGGWQILNCPILYTIASGSNYLRANGATLTNTTSVNDATRWAFSQRGSSPSGTISTTYNGTTYYVGVSQTSSGGCNPTYSYSLQFSTAPSSWTNSGGVLRNANYNTQYLVYSGGWTVGTSGTALTITPYQNLSGTALTIGSGAQEVASSPVLDGPVAEELTVSFIETEEQLYASAVSTVRRSSYFPIRVAEEEDPDYNASAPYAVSAKNTGYIVGGAYSGASGSGRGDIRISSYPISRINGSYSGGNFTTIYTYTGTGSPVAITAANKASYTQFDSVCAKFKQNLAQNTSNVYGLHFMDSSISTARLIQAEAVSIFGETYLNYDLPESSIDFNIVERGYITFMAGDYFTNNNAFFSLHQVFRNADKTISAIKQIRRVYQKPMNSILSPFVYEYTDGTYSAALPGDYVLAFDSAWITNPTLDNTALSGSRIYYFEIPCNAGEYALGSVDGKTGAYLLYLDIGTNAGSIMESTVSNVGNEVTDSFSVDFRYADDLINAPDTAVLQLAVDAPAVLDASQFSIHVRYDEEEFGSGMCVKGCYTITVTNTSGSDVTLYVFLCDDNADPTDEFQYAYKIVYTNSSHTATVFERTIGEQTYDYWKALAGFSIPSSGDAAEIIYE